MVEHRDATDAIEGLVLLATQREQLTGCQCGPFSPGAEFAQLIQGNRKLRDKSKSEPAHDLNFQLSNPILNIAGTTNSHLDLIGGLMTDMAAASRSPFVSMRILS